MLTNTVFATIFGLITSLSSVLAEKPVPIDGEPTQFVAVAAKKYKVQVRHPHHVHHQEPSLSAAKALAAKLHRQGWKTHIKKSGSGFVVSAKVSRWKTKTIAPNASSANAAASVLRHQGFHVRIVPTRR